MKKSLSLLTIIFSMCNLVKAQDTLYSQQEWYVFDEEKYKIFFTSQDSLDVGTYVSYFNTGIDSVEKFFGAPFNDPFGVVVHPNRASLDSQWSHDWGMLGFKSECWMIGSGVADKFDFLSPKSWKTDACEHDPNDSEEIQKFVTHELTHVYHGQVNEDHYFNNMEDLAWFIEGISVYVSGQLDKERIADLKDAFAKNEIPKFLRHAWSGDHRYGVCGSMAAYIDQKYGREKTFELLKVKSTSELLDFLNSNEFKFIAEWKKFVENM